MGQVIQLVSETAVDAAWEQLRDHSKRLVDNPRLLLDRGFVEEHTRLERHFKRLFLMQEPLS